MCLSLLFMVPLVPLFGERFPVLCQERERETNVDDDPYNANVPIIKSTCVTKPDFVCVSSALALNVGEWPFRSYIYSLGRQLLLIDKSSVGAFFYVKGGRPHDLDFFCS